MFHAAPFLTYIFLMAYTPGPNNVMSMNNAREVGFRRSFPFNIGVFCGTLMVMFLCAVLGGALFSALPVVKPVMCAAGALYMVWLAWGLVRPTKNKAAGEARGQGFLAGMLLQFVNAKIIVYGITAMSSYVLPYFSGAGALAAFSALLAAVGFSSTICWSFFGSGLSRMFKEHGRVINAVMALLLCYCAVSLFL